VRARAVEAASRLQSDGLRQEILYRLFSDRSFRVRVEAAVAAHRWSISAEDAAEVDNALARVALTGFEESEGALPPAEVRPEAPEVVWRALFSLQRRAWARVEAGQREGTPERVREAFLAWARPEARGEARLFAVKGLGALPTDEQVREALYAGLESADWRVVCEAANGLGKMPHGEALGPLERALGHASVHVRAQVAAALGAFAEQRQGVAPLLQRALGDPSPNVRAAALVSLGRLDGDGAEQLLAEAALDTDFRIRAGAVGALEHLAPELAAPILIQLSRDRDPLVSRLAAEALGPIGTPAARAQLRELAGGRDNALRVVAIGALAEDPSPEDLPLLASTWATSNGDIAAEVRVAALEAAAKIGGDEALALLRRGLDTGGFYERRVARAGLQQLLPQEPLPAISPPPRFSPPAPLPPSRERPTVEVITDRGTLVFELLPDEAPLHVRNFLELARQDHYDGLRFHRVVADFVVQGGDYRGDGYGGKTWNGAPLPAEFGPRKFERGALGMPRNADPESGGGQIFVTHRPTPHLDGRYTLFGELRQGFDVLAELEVGDRILDVKLRGARP
jgi:cyclophilin family peptidyl-prolyl cis-trans isomerase